ncbi:MAG: aldo/keto reductase [Anaerolineales bacterium]|nr:MAG: aldo/keto reductase [Anaerolineales bacterium]
MQYRNMGKSGLKLSAISLGAWVTFGDQIDAGIASDLIHRAYDAGINFFDNADIYAKGKAEEVMGAAIKDLPRQGLVISSKVFWPTMPGPNGGGLSRKHIIESCEASLRRLGLDYLDIYFCHRYDPVTPLDEVVRAMDDLIRQGKVLYWGTSEWRGAQIANAYSLALQYGGYAPVVEQPQYSMLVRRNVEAELVPAAEDLGFGMVTWSPLKFGLLSGKYNQGDPEEKTRLTREPEWGSKVVTPERLEKVRQLTDLARELDASTAQLAIAWLLRLPQVSSVITGATRIQHLDDNLGAIGVSDKLTPEVLERIEAILDNAPGDES